MISLRGSALSQRATFVYISGADIVCVFYEEKDTRHIKRQESRYTTWHLDDPSLNKELQLTQTPSPHAWRIVPEVTTIMEQTRFVLNDGVE